MDNADKMIIERKDRKLEEVWRFSNYDLRYSELSTERGQSTIEFTFAMMITLILIFALVMVFRWAGMDLAERRFAHERLMTNSSLSPYQQLDPDFYQPREIRAAYKGFNLMK